MNSKWGVAVGVGAAAAIVIAVVLVFAMRGGTGSVEPWMAEVVDEGPASPHVTLFAPSLEAFFDEDRLDAPILVRIRSLLDEAAGEEGYPEWREIGVDPSKPIGMFISLSDEDEAFLVTLGAEGEDDDARDAFYAYDSSEAEDAEESTHVAAGLTWRCHVTESWGIQSHTCVAAKDGRLRMATWTGFEGDDDVETVLGRTAPPTGETRRSDHPMMREAMRLPKGALMTALVTEREYRYVVQHEVFGTPGVDLTDMEFFWAVGLYADGHDLQLLGRSTANWHEVAGGFSFHPSGRHMRAILDMPSPTVASMQIRVPVEEVYDYFLQEDAYFREFGFSREDFEQMVSEQERALGLSLRDDLLAALDGDFLLAIHDLFLLEQLDRDAPGATLRIGLADEAKAEQLLDRLIGMAETEGVSVTQHSAAGSTFHTFDAGLGVSVQMGIHDGGFWVANGATALSRTLAGDLPQMGDEADSAHLQYMTSEGRSSAMFVDLSQIIGLLPEFGLDLPGTRSVSDGGVDLRMDTSRERDGLYNGSLRITNATAIIEFLSNTGF